ncbi:MAG: hypothetical protein JW941_05065 [Candidatus Coatesbacteria bacterium]|nr:hypothetical protein [Candidatus Coatesbacteria bacterium]
MEEHPEEQTCKNAEERLIFLAKIILGLEQANAGDTISHDEMKIRLERWLK